MLQSHVYSLEDFTEVFRYKDYTASFIPVNCENCVQYHVHLNHILVGNTWSVTHLNVFKMITTGQGNTESPLYLSSSYLTRWDYPAAWTHFHQWCVACGVVRPRLGNQNSLSGQYKSPFCVTAGVWVPVSVFVCVCVLWGGGSVGGACGYARR